MAEYIEVERARHEFALYFQDSKKLVDDCDSLICMLPTADVEEVRHGVWILKDNKGNGVCSVCNRQDGIDPLATHCRYCGAKIDGKDEGE